MKKVIFLFVFFFLTLSYSSDTQRVVNLAVQNYNIGKSISVFEDSSAEMDFEQISNLAADKFTPLNKVIDSRLFTTSAFWYKFDVLNEQDTPQKRLIFFGIPWLDNIKIIVINKDAELSTYIGGDVLAFNNRTLNDHRPNFEHEFMPGKSRVYVQVKTRDPFIVPISVIDSLSFLEKKADESNFTGFIYGIIVALLLYNLVLYLSMRARYYAFYVLYLSMFILAHSSYNCYTFKWILYDYPEIQNWAESTGIFLFTISGLLFAQSFLNLKKYFPSLYVATNYLIVFYISTMIFTSFLGYHYHIMFSIGLTVIYSLFVFGIAFYSLAKGNHYARFFLLGASAGLVGTSATALTVMAFIPYSDFGLHALDYGMVIDAVLLSLALADRMKISQDEKHTAEKKAKKAIEAKKAKEEFLSNMSHEIRTPLNAILGFIQILKKNTKDEKNLSYINTIYSSSQSLLHVINDILDFSKIENEKLTIDKHSFDPKYEFEQVSKLFEIDANSKSINLYSHIDENIPNFLEGDLIRIKQIMFNFLSNALKFTPKNKNVYINIFYKDNILSISIKDEGIGLSKEAQSKIFNAFEQADNSTSRKYGGTGLGLSISSKLCKLMDGKITLNSKEGEGSTFTLSLPINEFKSSVEGELFKDFNEPRNLQGNILIAEDNKTNQMLIKILLDEYGLKYHIANDGLEAVQAYTDSKFDLILMDESMPNMSGVEAHIKIKEYEKKHKLKAIPVVALTANVMEEDRKRFIEVGMEDFLAKPIDSKELDRVLNKFL